MFGDLNERQDEYLRDILASGRHLLELLNDVLDLSKVEAGAMELALAPVDVGTVVEHCVGLMRERATSKNLQLSAEVTADIGPVNADELRLKQILLNLLSNAVKFTPAGGTVQVSARQDGADVLVQVVDSGVGIPGADQDRIFDSFQQAGRSASRVEGTGLGLTLCKRIVELHGGQIDGSRASRGAGSTFSVRRPARRRAGREPAAVDPTPSGGAASSRTTRASLDLLRAYLTGSGSRSSSPATAPRGWLPSAGSSRTPSCSTSSCPGLDGWELLAALKAAPETARIPVIVVSVLDDRARAGARARRSTWSSRSAATSAFGAAPRRRRHGRRCSARPGGPVMTATPGPRRGGQPATSSWSVTSWARRLRGG